MASILKIAGAAVDLHATRTVIDRLTLSLDGYDTLEFSQVATIIPGLHRAHAAVELEVDGTARFRGQLVSNHYGNVGTGPIRVGYRAFGLEWLANRIPITGADGTGKMMFNLQRTDDDYIAALAGRSVGQILAAVFDAHAAELAAVGVAGYDPADMAALTVVPPEAVYLTGGLWGMAKALLAQWCNKYAPWIDPADGMIRVKSQLGGLTPLTLTLDSDPITLDSLAEDRSECATRIVLRGGPNVQAAYLNVTRDATLAEGWSSGLEADWTWADYIRPRDSADVGDLAAVGSTTIEASSDDPARTWAANYWSGVVAEVMVYDPVATGITFGESRRIVACTALSAGGTSTLTLDAPLENSGYTRYAIRGAKSPAAAVWRKLTVVPDYVRDHLVKRFSHDVPWSPTDGAKVMTTSPQAVVCYAPGCAGELNEFPVTFEIDPSDGSLWFSEPLVKPYSSMASLEAGTPDGIPCEVKVMVPYSRGAMSVTLPESGYEGTAFAADGLERTIYREYPQWLDYRDRAAYVQLAQEVLDTVKDTVIEGSITYHGKLDSALAKGVALNIARSGGTTGWEAAAATIRTVVLDYAPGGGSASQWITKLTFSNRLKPFAGDRLYAHPGFAARVDRREIAIDSRQGSHDLGAAMAEAQPRPDTGYAGPMDLGTVGRNTYRKPGKSTGLSAEERRRVAGDDADFNAREKDYNESMRRAAASGSRDHARALAGALGKDGARNEVERAGRETAQARAARSSRADASRLSHALGNPLGRGSTPADRRDDAMLADLADDSDRRRPRAGGGTYGIAYP